MFRFMGGLRSLKVVKASVIGLLLSCSVNVKAQLDLGQPNVWYSNASAISPIANLDLIGNHPILPQDSVFSAFQKIQDFKDRGHTLFLVVRPLYAQASGKTYLRCKGLEINDTAILYRGAGRSFNPDKYRPLILSASFPAQSRRGGRPSAPKIDTSLFKVAEIIAYNRFFGKQELRQMDAYLSLKYSIPTTKNDDKSLRAYPNDSASGYYWTPKRDKIYDREVIALGNFPFSGLQQSQTVAYHDDSLIVALDTIVPFGQMPARYLQEASFMVLSKRIDQSSLYDCELSLNQQFPITAWRLRTQNFLSNADSLKIYYPNHQQSSFNDTLILTDGQDTLRINAQQLGMDLSISLALSQIKANRVYRFRVKGNACDDTSSIGLSPQGPGLMALNVDPEMLPVQVEVQDLNSDQSYDTTMYQNPLQMQAGEGQFDVWVKDTTGALQRDFLVAGSNAQDPGIRFISQTAAAKQAWTEEGQRIVVYPNPGFTGEQAHFEFLDFPVEDELTIEIYDPQGRLMHQEELLISSSKQGWSHIAGIPGVYTIIVRHLDQAYSQKLTVKKRF